MVLSVQSISWSSGLEASVLSEDTTVPTNASAQSPFNNPVCPTLPQELWDSITEYLDTTFDLRTVLACNLVSNTLSNSARRILFRTIRIGTYLSTRRRDGQTSLGAGICTILAHTPKIGSMVQHLIVEGCTRDLGIWEPLPSIIEKLTSLTSVSVKRLSWGLLPPYARDAICKAIQSQMVQTIVLDTYPPKDQNITHVLEPSLTADLESVHSITISLPKCFKFDDHSPLSFQDKDGIRSSKKLESLSLNLDFKELVACISMFTSPSSPLSLGSIQSLSVTIWWEESVGLKLVVDSLNKLLGLVAPTLRCLRVQLDYPGPEYYHDSLLDLQPTLGRLQYLYITLEIHGPWDFQIRSIGNILTTFFHYAFPEENQLQTLHIAIELPSFASDPGGYPYALLWRTIQDTLSRFKGLECLRLSLSTGNSNLMLDRVFIDQFYKLEKRVALICESFGALRDPETLLQRLTRQ